MIAAITQIALASAFSFGSCPTIEKARDPVSQNHTQFGGLWYEYVSSEGYKGSNPYDCATWNLLYHSDTNANEHKYDLIHHALNRTTNETFFDMNTFIC